jgi:branched-chain amino acid transport system substrate-binding protein
MRHPSFISFPLLSLLAAFGPGCTLGRFEHTACVDNASCREAFGWGSTCGDDGLCAPIEAPPRCQVASPSNFWSDLDLYTDAVVIGMSYDHTYSADVQSMRLAFSQVADQQGLQGRDYVLVECDNVEDDSLDTLSQEEAAIETSLWLADTLGVPAILGCDNSTSTEAAFVAVQPLGTMMMSPAATSPTLSDLDGLVSTDEAPGLLWRTVPPDTFQAEIIARTMVEDLDARVVLVIYETGAYGEGLEEAFYSGFVAEGRSVVLKPYSNRSERDEAFAALGDSGRDQVLLIASDRSDVVAFFYAAVGFSTFTGAEPMGIFLTDGAYYMDIYDEVAASRPDAVPLFDLVRGTRPYFDTSNKVYSIYYTAYAAMYGGLDPGDAAYGASGYDSAWLSIYAAAWSYFQESSITGLGMAKGMRHLSSGDLLLLKPSSWNSVLAHFEVGQGIDVAGASGELDYDPNTGETSGPIEVWGIDSQGGGSFVFTSEAIY